MKLAVIVTLCIAHGVNSQGILGSLVNGASNVFNGILGGVKTNPCDQNVHQLYSDAQSKFYKKLYAKVAAHSDNHFVFSPYTIWLSLAGLAEGADPSVQSLIYNSLDLPQQECLRRKFYDIATHVERPGRDVSLRRRRSLILDEDLQVNPKWANLVHSTGILDVAVAPIKRNPVATSRKLKQFLASRSNIVLTGNSVLLDALDFHGLWTTAFSEANIYRAPFYNDMHQQIGTVDMMKMTKKVRLAQVPFMNTKIVELPVGSNGRYTMLIAVGTGSNIIQDAMNIFLGSIMEIFSALQMSLVPIEVAIPKFTMSSEFDAKPSLEDVGIDWFWKDPAATSYVSHPAAMPGGLIQRVTVRIGSQGVEPPPQASNGIISGLVNFASDAATGLATAVGHEFTADRPFMYALFDTATHTCLFAGAFSRPNAQ